MSKTKDGTEVIPEKGKTITFHLSKRDIECLQQYLIAHGQDPCQWEKAARRYAKEGNYHRIRAFLDAIIL